jgi:intergrase/recombinase
LRLCGKEDVHRALEAMGGLNKSSYEAFSRFLTYLEKTKEVDELVVKLRKAMPQKPKTGTDTYVPSDRKIMNLKKKIAELGEPYTLFYNILVSTGCRGTEARYLIENINKLRVVDLGPFVRIHVDLERGSKNEYVMYLPKEVYEQLLKFNGKLPHQDTIEDRFRESGLAIKYFRKWWRQLGKKQGIDSEDLEAFQGRVSSIGGRHYTDWIPILDEDYRRILPQIRKYLIINPYPA